MLFASKKPMKQEKNLKKRKGLSGKKQLRRNASSKKKKPVKLKRLKRRSMTRARLSVAMPQVLCKAQAKTRTQERVSILRMSQRQVKRRRKNSQLPTHRLNRLIELHGRKQSRSCRI